MAEKSPGMCVFLCIIMKRAKLTLFLYLFQSPFPINTEDKDVLEKSSNGYTALSSEEFACRFCPGTFKRLGNMRNHLEKTHGTTFNFNCNCGECFKDSTAFTRKLVKL